MKAGDGSDVGGLGGLEPRVQWSASGSLAGMDVQVSIRRMQPNMCNAMAYFAAYIPNHVLYVLLVFKPFMPGWCGCDH